MEADYYKVMGLPRVATSSEIRARYKQLAKRHHPDHFGSTDTMSLINRAYSVLADPISRYEYNRTLEKPSGNRLSNKRPTRWSAPQQQPVKYANQPPVKRFAVMHVLFSPIGVVTLLLSGLILSFIWSSVTTTPLKSNVAAASSSANSDPTQTLVTQPSSSSTLTQSPAPTSTPSPVAAPTQTPVSSPGSTAASTSSCSYLVQPLERQIQLTEARISRLQSQQPTTDGYSAMFGNSFNDSARLNTLQQQLSMYQSELSSAQSGNC